MRLLFHIYNSVVGPVVKKFSNSDEAAFHLFITFFFFFQQHFYFFLQLGSSPYISFFFRSIETIIVSPFFFVWLVVRLGKNKKVEKKNSNVLMMMSALCVCVHIRTG